MAVAVRPGAKPAKIDAPTAQFLPWLERHVATELRDWNDLLRGTRLSSPYRKFSVARAYDLTHAVCGVRDDGCWVARVRAIFCAVSPIAESAEELILASWWRREGGGVVTWYTHQDEWDIQEPMPSIATYMISDYESWNPDARPPPEWRKAAMSQAKGFTTRFLRDATPSHLSAPLLQRRTDWIIDLFLGITCGEDDSIEAAPVFADWRAERRLARTWPHLQAYWLLHHLVWDNVEELPSLLRSVEITYPAVAELVEWANIAMRGGALRSKPWNQSKVRAMRARAAARGRSPMSPAAIARHHRVMG